MSGPFVKKKLIIRFDGRRSSVLSYKKVRDGVEIVDRWKTVVDQLGLKIGCLLGFKLFQPYSDFLFTTFYVDFDVVCKKKPRFSNFYLVDDAGDKNRSSSYIILDPSRSHVAIHTKSRLEGLGIILSSDETNSRLFNKSR
ncbi:hypothetical protein Hdeb2414_s0001g00015221 [Helianthus debilis subsp. tardiflorus]